MAAVKTKTKAKMKTKVRAQKTPKFSILLPTKDRLELLQSAVATVLMQSYKDWEIIVSDNASKDDIRGYVEGLDDVRVKYIRCDEPVNVTENWNRAYEASSGQYVTMLGDDDGLVPDYFTRIEAYMKQLEQPDFIYHSAYHFAFPNVLKGMPEGAVQDITPSQRLFDQKRTPYILEEKEAHIMAEAALDMRLLYSFNMQYFVFKRSFLEGLKTYGAVFQGPYPDFYAANLALLEAGKVGVVPFPMTVIGVSPKSYGFYHFNDDEDAAVSFLDNNDYVLAASEDLQGAFLPGSQMNTQWLISVEQVAEHLKGRGLKLGVKRYRILQILNMVVKGFVSKTKVQEVVVGLWPELSLMERVVLILALIGGLPLFVLRGSLRVTYTQLMLSVAGQYGTFWGLLSRRFVSLFMRLVGLGRYDRPWDAVKVCVGSTSVVDVFSFLVERAGNKK